MKKHLIISILLIFPQFLIAQNIDTTFVQADGIKLYTVLTKPSDTNTSPLAVIIGGSGPTDLNGNQPNMHTNSLRYLSDALVENNIATLRFDKRGIGKSRNFMFNEANLTIDQYANDIKTLINHCKEKGYSDIYIIGHSEGSLIGLISLRDINAKGFISISGAGSSADKILKKQLKPKLPQVFYTQVESIIDSLKDDHLVKNVPPQLNFLFRPSVQPYLISWFNYSPAELINKISCSNIIIQGDKDIQVGIEEANKLAKASKHGKLLIVNKMNHVLKTIDGGMQENVASYNNPSLPINQELVNGIVHFINQSR